jgi:hypothetical protein
MFSKNADLHESFLTNCFSFSNHGPRGSDGVTIWKSIFTTVYIGGEILKMFDRLTDLLANFNKI